MRDCGSSFLFQHTTPTELYTLSLRDALPISPLAAPAPAGSAPPPLDLDTAALDQTLRSEEHTSELQSQFHLVCRLLREATTDRQCARVGLCRFRRRLQT